MPVLGQAVLGLNAVTYENILYDGTQASYDTPEFAERTNVQDVTVNQSMATADVSTRGGGGYRQVLGTLAEGAIDFTMIYAPGDALFTTLNAAFANRSLVDMIFADDVAITGPGADNLVTDSDVQTGESVSWFRAEFAVLDFTQEQPLEDALKVNVTIQSGFSNNIPAWTTIIGTKP